MDEGSITQYITNTFANVETDTAFGYLFFFCGADHKRPFATLGTQDDEYDHFSNLNRPGVFRLNIGVSRDSYRSLFGPPPSNIDPAAMVEKGYDFTSLDQLLPH